MRRLFALVVSCGAPALAQPGGAPPTGPAPATEGAPETAPAAPITAAVAPASTGGRLTEAALQALEGEAPGICDAHKLPEKITVGACAVVGPLPGLIIDGVEGSATESHADALAACARDPRCLGVSSKWYMGSPWYPVTGGTWAIDRASYGCTLVLKCPAEAPPKP